MALRLHCLKSQQDEYDGTTAILATARIRQAFE
jgi:hypothetical protein